MYLTRMYRIKHCTVQYRIHYVPYENVPYKTLAAPWIYLTNVKCIGEKKERSKLFSVFVFMMPEYLDKQQIL